VNLILSGFTKYAKEIARGWVGSATESFRNSRKRNSKIFGWIQISKRNKQLLQKYLCEMLRDDLRRSADPIKKQNEIGSELLYRECRD
jgi:hypothetical protein